MCKSRKYFMKLLFVILTVFSVPSYGASLPDELLKIPIQLTSGGYTSLNEYKGKKPVYLKFWATWCQPCRKEMPHFEHVKKEYGESVEIIGINLGVNDDIDAVNKIINEFGLTMSMAIDKNGDLAQAFRMVGTPYHLLFDKNMNLIHQGHQANESLDNKLALVSQTKSVDLLDVSLLSESDVDLKLATDDGRTHALFFTATWCDWYLEDSRPNISENCASAQESVNDFFNKYPDPILIRPGINSNEFGCDHKPFYRVWCLWGRRI